MYIFNRSYKFFLIKLTLILIGANATAQLPNDDLIDEVANNFNNDLSVLSMGFAQPLINASIYGQNAMWANTTETLKPFEFKFGAVLTTVNVPAKDEFFTPPQLNYFEATNSLSTILGSSSETTLKTNSTLEAYGLEATLTFPSGVKNDLPNEMFILPSFSAALGLFKSTEVQINFFPEYDIEGLTYSYKGLAVKHGIDQYFKKDQESNWHLAISANYSTSEMMYLNNDSDVAVNFDITSIAANTIFSYDTKFLSLFGGLGYFSSDYSFEMDNAVAFTGAFSELLNPLIQDVSFDDTLAETFAFVGFSLDILFLEIITKYNIQAYNSLQIGVNIDF